MARLLLLLPKTSYRSRAFLDAARSVGVEILVAADRPSSLEEDRPRSLMSLDFDDPAGAAAILAERSARDPVDAVVSTDDRTAVVAAAIAERLGARHHSLPSAETARDKRRMREALAAAGVPVPRFACHPLDADPEAIAGGLSGDGGFPCVLKPLRFSAGRGVLRSDGPSSFVEAFRRIASLVREDEPDPEAHALLVEEFVGGPEVALEGLVVDGVLETLAIFDKPDPLEGPTFEETIYVTPSRLPAARQAEVEEVVRRAAGAIGLSDGPLHAELRLSGDGPRVIEVAARAIGGLCSRTLRFGTGLSLEEIIVLHALRLPIPSLERERPAAGVFMMPVERRGTLEGVDGIEEAEALPGIEEVALTMHAGQEAVPLPEGSRYLGFIFARGERPSEVEEVLREAWRRLKVRIRPE